MKINKSAKAMFFQPWQALICAFQSSAIRAGVEKETRGSLFSIHSLLRFSITSFYIISSFIMDLHRRMHDSLFLQLMQINLLHFFKLTSTPNCCIEQGNLVQSSPFQRKGKILMFVRNSKLGIQLQSQVCFNLWIFPFFGSNYIHSTLRQNKPHFLLVLKTTFPFDQNSFDLIS